MISPDIASTANYSDGKQLVLTFFSLLFLAIHYLVIFAIVRLLTVFESAQPFSPKLAPRVSFLGAVIILFCICWNLKEVIISLILTYDAELGFQGVIVEVSGVSLFLMLIGGLMFIFGKLLGQAEFLYHENRQIV